MHQDEAKERERRTDRRASRRVSLDRWLASVATQTGASELVITDACGRLVAASTGTEAAGPLAAEALTLGRKDSRQIGRAHV